MIKAYIAIALNNLSNRRLRSWLTMLGIFIGIAVVVALISLSQGMQDAINTEFEKLGSDKITVMPAGSLKSGPPGSDFTSAKLTSKDVETIERVRGVQAASGRILKTAKVSYNNKLKFRMVAGIEASPDSRKILQGTGFTEVERGRFLKNNDKFKIIVGNNYLKEDTFGKPLEIGQKIEINDQEFEVAGILKKNGLFFVDNAIIMRKEVFMDLYNIDDEESAIAVLLSKGFSSAEVADRVERKLRSSRNVEEGKEDFMVQTPQQLLDTFNTVFNIVTAVVIGVAGISILVGAVGITNTMYTAVLERTKEIGIMKSIGARNTDVFLIFFIESGLLGMTGGIIGVALGMAMGKLVELIATKQFGSIIIAPHFSLTLMLGALTVSFLLGSFSGTFPALQAANMHPVDALREE